MGKGISAADMEIFGWALGSAELSAPAPQLESLLDQLDRQYEARMDGMAAALGGQLLGENPQSCPVCHAQWAAGWAEGNARAEFLANLCGKQVVTVGLPGEH